MYAYNINNNFFTLFYDKLFYDKYIIPLKYSLAVIMKNVLLHEAPIQTPFAEKCCN